ncbi:ParB/RepB/Spo0J family partition protein [Streptomyces venezuelae]|uniref:ParB/RepB/Spo0J family partition protein n=1 Tax=Streptomyces venezuelae TaxID=54571 RepID=UPI003424EBA4
MSIADKVGESSFGRSRSRSARGRAKAITEGSIPDYELARLPLDQVSPTPLNPRRNFGTDEQQTRFGEELRQVQLAACVVVSRSAYLKLWPDHEQTIGPAAQYVLVNGERRYHSAVHVGLDKLDFVIRDDLASSREEFVDHLLKENLEREDFDVIERARGVQELVQVCAEQSERGARTRAADRLGKNRSWITNQLALLDLPHEVQAMLSSGAIAERDGRSLARHLKDHPDLSAADLIAYLKAAKETEAQAKAEEKAILQAAKESRSAGSDPSLLSADNKESASDEAPTEQPDEARSLSADNKPSIPRPLGSSPQPERASAGKDHGSGLLSADNKPRAEAYQSTAESGAASASNASVTVNGVNTSSEDGTADGAASTGAGTSGADGNGQPRRLPYDDAVYIVRHLHVKMTTDNFVQGARSWMALLREQHPEEYRTLLRELAEQGQPA